MSRPPRLRGRWPRCFVGSVLLLAAGGCGGSEAGDGSVQEISATVSPVQQESLPPPRAGSRRAGLGAVEVELASARLLEDRLEIELVFDNVSDDAFGLLGALGADDFALIEDGGETLEPVALSEALELLDSGGGIKPGERKRGGVAFPRPIGASFALRVDGFEPLRFDWRHIVEAPASPPSIAPGIEEGPPPDPQPPPVSHRRPSIEELDRLLEEQAEAITSYDLDRYLATFAADRREQEREIFRRLRSLPVTGVGMRIDRILDGDGRRARVELRFRFDGLPDDNPFVHAPTYAFARAATDRGCWRVAAIEDRAGRPIPWRRGELAVHRSHHFLILSEPRMRSQLTAVAADAEAAYAALRSQGLPLASGYAVFFVADGEEFRDITRQSNALGAALGRYLVDGDRTTVDSRAFYVNGPLFVHGRGPALPRAARRLTVTHELVHLALAADTRPQTPPWLKEGVAVYFAGDLSFDANRSLVRRGLEHLDLARMTRSELGGHGSAERRIADEYLFAGNVIAWLVERHGRGRLLEFYRSYGRSPSPGVTSLAPPALLAAMLDDPFGDVAAEMTEAALAHYYGIGLVELEAAVKEWLRVPHR